MEMKKSPHIRIGLDFYNLTQPDPTGQPLPIHATHLIRSRLLPSPLSSPPLSSNPIQHPAPPPHHEVRLK